MKKKILMTGLVAGGLALSATAFANSWLLYLPAILAGSQGGGTIDPPVVTGALNDTGIITTVGNTDQEDADYGRDANAETNSNDDGHAGFSFETINDGACVLDNVTGLVWEVKVDTGDPDNNPGDKEKTYDWAGAKNYAENFTGCGDSYTCRLPTLKELLGIVSWGSYVDTTHEIYIDAAFFPNTAAATYLTGTEVANASSAESTHIWGFDFSQGTTDSAIYKISSGYSVRAVCTVSSEE
ncbi:MAG: DUF1566 domain-containing protein [Candidatus Electrothrix sp. EH2]|nr:DUF1566 domain-containing protein [Candidatus Electrothrix sp. EH2]